MKPEFGLVQSRADGSFIACKLNNEKVILYSKSGQESASMTFSDLDRTRMLYRCIPKSEYNTSSDRRTDTSILSTKYAFDELGSLEVASNGLVSHFSPFAPIEASSQLNTPVAANFAAKAYPRIVEAQFEPDRFAVSHTRGTYWFESTRWKELGNMGWPPLPPTKSLLPGYYGAKFDLFSRFLHEYNLIGMNRDEVMRLLGPGDPSANNSTSSLRHMILFGGCCGGAYVFVDINFQNDAVSDWCFASADGKKSASFTTNVVLVPEICAAESLTHQGPQSAQPSGSQQR